MTTDHKKLLAGTEVLKASPAEVALQSIHEILFPDGDPDHDSGSQELGEIINVVTAVIPAPEHHPLVLVGDFLNNIHTAFDHLQEVGWAEKNKSEVASIVGRDSEMALTATRGKSAAMACNRSGGGAGISQSCSPTSGSTGSRRTC